jgi:hypothetical protein
MIPAMSRDASKPEREHVGKLLPNLTLVFAEA